MVNIPLFKKESKDKPRYKAKAGGGPFNGEDSEGQDLLVFG